MAKRHGEQKTPLYNHWRSIIGRCSNESNSNWHRYGGRGIKVCDAWRDYTTFAVWARANGYVPGRYCQIDRIDNDGDYTPENCHYVTIKENCNNKSDNTYITDGVRKYRLSEVRILAGLSRDGVNKRLQMLIGSTVRGGIKQVSVETLDLLIMKSNRLGPFTRNSYELSMKELVALTGSKLRTVHARLRKLKYPTTLSDSILDAVFTGKTLGVVP